MLIHGRNLFPLTKINARAVGYHMDRDGEVWSERARQGQLLKLSGSQTGSGRYITLQTNGSFSQSYRLDQLQYSARSHNDFLKDTAVVPHLPDLASVLGLRGQVAKAAAEAGLNVPAPELRHHAASINEGIKSRGWVIATVVEGALSFGHKPVIHTREQSVNDELKRLAALKTGTKFVKLKIEGALTVGTVWE